MIGSFFVVALDTPTPDKIGTHLSSQNLIFKSFNIFHMKEDIFYGTLVNYFTVGMSPTEISHEDNPPLVLTFWQLGMRLNGFFVSSEEETIK